MLAMDSPIKSLKSMPCEARQTKLSNGCRSHSMITTVARLVLPSTHCCAACTMILDTRTCWRNSVYLQRHDYKAFFFLGTQATKRFQGCADLCGRGVAAD